MARDVTAVGSVASMSIFNGSSGEGGERGCCAGWGAAVVRQGLAEPVTSTDDTSRSVSSELSRIGRMDLRHLRRRIWIRWRLGEIDQCGMRHGDPGVSVAALGWWFCKRE